MTEHIPPDLYAVVPCAGVGQRAGAGGPKQYADVAGRSLVAHTLEALAAVTRLKAVLVVLSPGDTAFPVHAPDFAGWVCHGGGATRADTVAQGLRELLARGARLHDWVLVHDAARCLVRPEWIDTLIDACLPDPVGGLLALPVPDTLKRESDGRVGETVDRGGMWQAQTPQMFRLGPLMAALASATGNVTDEASAIEATGQRPLLVPGSLENFKITWPADFALAERLLRTRP
ncbi:2-C-methyl-D-erythritol 4-phosphate cytidylyltransferase [Piscinibacter gummiphilus]|uniref:2-C-methyl-D-erythritol 4-phosphate cytidylyltransferase n=1 Tax=Piscinibacter gummiphilus TaxID=946333 RepID=A0A1W6LAH1_9BURK|nr:2-C-methyl-D-erythritol 4-phosphate cytidylyltransferase [Piscinibacter gummiphilus]ARN21187.1 2-C-methyl-D-erythritol 4-phosphate cytidylyltransferase [Piscinibacter gummiphilus]ATU65870.1 2-C-methyl-D-erythritol 4-phosphate cytidylyltransferase [Piscinibacter gummiphilus]GLS93748.1 2-C-methyl-D-erythritol 4-phosphate cytidylyltransferase [Piscinibacter gummiphilus]